MTAINSRYALFLSLILAFARKGITHIGQALDREVPTSFVTIIPPLPKDQVALIQPNANIMCVGFGRRSDENSDKIGFKNQLPTQLSGQIGATEVGLKQFLNSRIMPGDSGGPMFLEMDDSSWRLIGIHSRSPRANLNFSVGIAGFVTSIIDWLQWDSGADLGVKPADLTIDEELANEYFLEAKHLRRNGTTGIAIEMLEKVLQVNPENPEAHNELALHYLEAPNVDQAHQLSIKHSKLAYELDPFSFSTIHAKALMVNQQWEEALKLLQAAIDFDSENLELIELRTKINKQLGRTEEVVSDMFLKERVDVNLMPDSGYDPRLNEPLSKAVDQLDPLLVRNLLTRGAEPSHELFSKLSKANESTYQIFRLLFLNAGEDCLKQTIKSADFWKIFHYKVNQTSETFIKLVADSYSKTLSSDEKNKLLEECLIMGYPFDRIGWTLEIILEGGAKLESVSARAVCRGHQVWKYPASALINRVKASTPDLMYVAQNLQKITFDSFIKDNDRLALWKSMLSNPQAQKVATEVFEDIGSEVHNNQFRFGSSISQVLEDCLKKGANPDHTFKLRSGFIYNLYTILLTTGGHEFKQGPLRSSNWNKWPKEWFDVQQMCFKLLLQYGGSPQQGIPFSIVRRIDYYDTPLAIQNALNTADLFLQAGDNPHTRYGEDRLTAREYLEDWKFDSIYIEWKDEPSYDVAKKLKKMLRSWERKRR